MVGAKAQPTSVLMPTLEQQDNFELRNRAWVRRVLHNNGQASGVLYMDENGEEVTQPADLVILAGFTVPNIRMLLLSKIGEAYDPGTGRGALGRRFTQQMGKVTGGPKIVFDEPLNLFMGAGGLAIKVSDFDRDRASEAEGTFLRGGNFGFGASGSTPIRGFESAPPGSSERNWGSAWKGANLEHYDRVVSVHGMDAEHLSYRRNLADLDPTYTDRWGDPLLRLTLDFTEHEVRQSRFTAKVLRQFSEAIARAGKAKLVDRPYGIPGGGRYAASLYQTTHLQGGAAMGVSPGDSVVNPHLQHWDVPNLWVVGASSFPQAGSTNPTLTALAVAYRAADALIERYLKRPGLVG
jgi:gluconate 2-dehydrogenase alpha chain